MQPRGQSCEGNAIKYFTKGRNDENCITYCWLKQTERPKRELIIDV